MTELATCNQCLNTFEPKRSDQKFCSLNCKNKHNNKKVKAQYHQRKREDVYSRNINIVLMNNRNILKAYCDKQVQLETLEKVGFQLNKITAFEQSDSGRSPRLFCYDYGYQFVEEKVLKIFKR